MKVSAPFKQELQWTNVHTLPHHIQNQQPLNFGVWKHFFLNFSRQTFSIALNVGTYSLFSALIMRSSGFNGHCWTCWRYPSWYAWNDVGSSWKTPVASLLGLLYSNSFKKRNREPFKLSINVCRNELFELCSVVSSSCSSVWGAFFVNGIFLIFIFFDETGWLSLFVLIFFFFPGDSTLSLWFFDSASFRFLDPFDSCSAIRCNFTNRPGSCASNSFSFWIGCGFFFLFDFF